MARDECLWCESKNLADGKLQTSGLVYFKPAKTKFWTFDTSMVEVQARVCVDCGYIDLYADTSKLKRLVKK